MVKRTNDTRTLIDKIEEYTVEDDNGCWIWQLSKNNVGYGMLRDGDKMRTAHRVSYEEYNNTKIPRNICIVHTCGNYACANPNHLYAGDRKAVVKSAIDRGTINSFGGMTRLGMKNPTTKCPYCQRDVANNLFQRHHNHNCKSKPKSINTLHSGKTVP